MKTSFLHTESRAIADLTIDGDHYAITRIYVPEAFRGKGIGSKLLDLVCEHADKCGVKLMLQVAPSGGLNARQLRKWYVSRGFVSYIGNSKYALVFERFPKVRAET